jgi:hypothetical protein
MREQLESWKRQLKAIAWALTPFKMQARSCSGTASAAQSPFWGWHFAGLLKVAVPAKYLASVMLRLSGKLYSRKAALPKCCQAKPLRLNS